MNNKNKVAIIVSHGSLKEAYPPLNLALGAAAMEAEVAMFFTMDGMKVLLSQSQPDLGDPDTTAFMAGKGMPNVADLIAMAQESGVQLIACQQTLDMLEIPAAALPQGVTTAGAATFLAFAMKPEAVSFTF